MKIILTSCFWDFRLESGREVAGRLIERNGLCDTVRSVWPRGARVLIISSYPDDYPECDRVCDNMLRSFTLSGLDLSSISICDNRNPEVIERLSEVDVLVLAGGHVPTQNAFMMRLGLRERLRDYDGVVMALSAGSMNSADTVYAIPELSGEATDPLYRRWISGLGLTDINIFPHYQYLKEASVDGLCMSRDIAFPDSMGREIIALNDGSYIFISDGKREVRGESYLIKNGEERLLTRDGESAAI